MNTLEPLLFNWSGNGVHTDENYVPRLRNNWTETADFIFHQAASDLCEEIGPLTIREKFNELVESEVQPIEDVISTESRLLRQQKIASSEGPSDPTYYFRGSTVVIPSRRVEGLVRLVSNNKNSTKDLLNKLKEKMKEAAERFHGAGVEGIEVYTEENFTNNMLEYNQQDIDIEVKSEEPGEFESQVLEELKPLSQSFTGSTRIEFKNYSPDPEFDILHASGPNSILQVEVKDFSGTNNRPGEEDVIHKPLRKASLLNITRTFSVVKGVNSGKMRSLKKSSELRSNIEIINLKELKENISPLLERSATAGPMAYYRYNQ